MVLCAVTAVSLASCGNSPAATPQAGKSTPVLTTQAVTATPAAQPANTPAEAKVDARAVEFEVWQDFMPVVPKEGAPLHGVVTVAITYTEKLTPQKVSGTVDLTRAKGGAVVQGVPVALQGQAGDLATPAPGPQSVVLVFGPATTTLTLSEGEMIGGTLSLTVGGEKVMVMLPEVALYFTH